MKRVVLWKILAVIAFSYCPTLHAAEESTLENQRSVFRDIYPLVERGDWAPAAANEALLATYVLWPDIRATYLKTRLRKNELDEIQAFLAQYGTLKPARDLRYRHALQLAADNKYADFLALYRNFYDGLGDAGLDCLALNAEIATGKTDSIARRAEPLWLVGTSQVDECDPVFSYLRESGQLDSKLHRARFQLAKEENQFSLALHLARLIDAKHESEAKRWLEARDNPEQFIQQSNDRADSSADAKQLVYAIKNVAIRDPSSARQLWLKTQTSRDFSQDLLIDVDRHIALWAARNNLPDASTFLRNLSGDAVNDEVVRWRLRIALRAHDWAEIPLSVEDLSIDERQQEQWQFWKAVALEKTGRAAESMLVMAALAENRGYYGFLAADELGLEYSFSHTALENNDEVIDQLAENPQLVRAHELYQVGLDGRGRSEWDAAIQTLNEKQQQQAALLADRWGWHSRAISTVAKTGDFDDLDLRYPLPHRESFELYSSDANIRESWAYGVARNESLFMRDIRSSAGAIGVMQLMPTTGRNAARELGYPYKGRNTLIDVSSNIRLGTFYLGKMYDRFSRHAALATAAYNAGPRRVQQWLPQSGAVDARIWIETIPFDETRDYVRKVLESDTIFHWRLTGDTRRISNQLPKISATGSAPQVASN